MRSKWPFVIVLLVGISFGYGQEYVKIAINFSTECAAYGAWDQLNVEERLVQLEKCRLNRPTDYYHNHKPLASLASLTRLQLSLAKWGAALLFVFFYWWLARWGLRKGFGDEFPIKFLDYGSGGLAAVCVFIFGIGYVTGLAPAYDVAREILGGLQSLVPFVMLVLGYSLYLRLKI